MLLHKRNSISIILGDLLCRADSQGTRWVVEGEGAQYLHLPELSGFVWEPKEFLQGV